MGATAKPTNAIKSASEYLKVNDKRSAIQCLYDSLEPSRNKIWSPDLEEVINMLLDICIDIQESDPVKEALVQYRNICQVLRPASMTTIVTRLLDNCSQRIEMVQKEYSLKTLNSVFTEEVLSSDDIIMSIMSDASSPQRVESEVVYPLIKFYWDVLRSVLDLLKVNSTMEELYHSVCERTFDFCVKYNRVAEFRTLRRYLHKHLEYLMEPVQDQTMAKFRVSWCEKTIVLQMETRFKQFDAACKLGLWTEASMILADIHGIMVISPYPRELLKMYYQRLSALLWEFKNYFYYAFAMMKLLEFCKNDANFEKEKETMCAQIVLSAICSPVYSATDDESHPDFKNEREKEQAILRLLNTSTHLTHSILFSEIRSQDILANLPSELVTLYNVIENEFHPLDMVECLLPILEWMKQTDLYAQFLPQLRAMILIRSLRQLESVYSVIKLENYDKLISDLSFDRHEAERIISEASSSKQLHVRVDYANHCVYFRPHLAEREVLSSYLLKLSCSLSLAMAKVQSGSGMIEDREEELYQRAETARDVKEAINQAMIERYSVIEQKKKESERVELDRNLSETERMRRVNAEREEKERARLKEEEDRRKRMANEKLQRQNEEKERQAIIAKLGELLGPKLDVSMVSKMNRDQLQNYASEVQRRLKKEREEKVARESEQQLFFSRALREVALPATLEFFDTLRQRDEAYWTGFFEKDYQQKKERQERMQQLHPVSTKLAAVLPIFERNIVSRRAAGLESVLEERFQKAEEERRAEEARRRAEEEERLRIEEEARRRAEEEARRREEEEKKRAEEEAEQKRLAEEKRQASNERLAKMKMNAVSSIPMRRRRGPPSAASSATAATAATAATGATGATATATTAATGATTTAATGATAASSTSSGSAAPSVPLTRTYRMPPPVSPKKEQEEDEWITVGEKPKYVPRGARRG